MPGELENSLRELIKSRYGEMKAFAVRAGIPNSTLDSMFKRGILSSSISNVIRLAEALNISVDGLAAGKIEPVTPPGKPPADPLIPEEAALVEGYQKLNADGRQYIQQQMRIALTLYAGECDDAPYAKAVNE